ncbi:MAG: DNA polymerase III subunit alpha [Proteobacteria bacterium]|nr:DNA polymerase III subunit alpha [Pseudomonadota bacterium]
MQNKFVHLRVHTQYSIGEGTLFVKKIPDLCKKYGMPACAITDTNLMSGTPEMSDACKKNGVQPIIGLVATLNHHATADPKILRADQLSQIVLLAQNPDGFFNLSKLNSAMYMRRDNNHLGPYVTWDELAENSAGAICLSGGHSGPIGRAILNGQEPLAAEYAAKLHAIFGDKFYMEIQRHGLPNETKTEPVFLRLATEQNIPIVATNDVCFATSADYESADALGCVLQQTRVIDPDRPRKNSQQYFKSADEMSELFSDLPEALENTINIARRCAFAVNTGSPPLLPMFGTNFDAECQMLRDNTIAGLKKRMAENNIPEPEQKKYFDQAEFELNVIIGMKFPGYFLIVADYIGWCEAHDILVGPGRGSGAGSVVSWALGITKVNPLEYGLLFERFLNPDRISMPDFDVDFEPDGLERVWKYISDKYGPDHVCKIITFGSLQARGTIRDIGRVYGVPYSKTDRFAKLIPMDAKTLAAAVKSSDEIQNALDADPELKKVVSIASDVEGAYRNLGQHACGIVIGDRPTVQIAPVYRDPSNDMPSVQFDGHIIENVGLIKFDFLGLETLTVLKNATELVRKTHGINIDLNAIPTNDAKTFALWQRGLTIGVFQFDAPFVQQTLKKMRPTAFADIVALNAMNRPGPIAFIPQYIARMHGEEETKYPHPRAEEVLRETYGIFVYQEQVMQLSRVLAGFTRGESDTLRKGMGKKIKKVMDEMRVKFTKGCAQEKTLTPEQAEEMYQQFMKFAEYAFNKAHAVAYSIIANQCAYLKANFPAEFLAASMSSNMNNSDQLALHLDDAKNNFNLDIVPPDINNSESLFSVKNGKIIYALAAIKGVGRGATEQIIAERNARGAFKNLTDFAKRCAPFLNKRVLEAFVKVGATDTLCPNRARLYLNADAILMYAAKQKDSANSLSLFADSAEDDVMENRLLKNLPNAAAWDFGEMLANEHSVLGFYISAHPIDQFKNLIARERLTTSETLPKKRDRENVRIAASVNSFSRRTTKTGNQMISIAASDSFGNIDAVAFGDSVPQIAGMLANEKLVLLSGRVSVRDDRVSLFVDSAAPLFQWVANAARKITLDPPPPTGSGEASIAANNAILSDIKKILDALPAGGTRVFINLRDGAKNATIALPRSVRLSPTITTDMSALGVKVSME